MKRLHKYMIRSFIGPFLLTFIIAMIVLMMNFVWLYIDELVGKGLGWEIILELLAYLTAKLIPTALVLGTLLASIMTFGNLGEYYELTAMKSSGISLIRIMLPVFVFSLALGAGSLLFSNYFVPVNNLKFSTLLLDIRAQRPEFDIREGQFYDGLEGYSLKIGDRSQDGTTLYDIMIYDHSLNKGNTAITIADSGYMRVSPNEKNLIIRLFNGSSYTEQLSDNNEFQENRPLRQDHFSEQEILLELPGTEINRSRQDLLASQHQMLNMKQLKDTAQARYEEMIWRRNKLGHDLLENRYLILEKKNEVRENPDYYQDTVSETNPGTLIGQLSLPEQREIYREALNQARLAQTALTDSFEAVKARKRYANMYWNEWNRKITTAVACLVFFLIGAPLGAIIRKGGFGAPMVVSVVLYIIYYIISIAGEKYARAGFWPSWLGMWASTLLLLPASLFLVYKASRDSAILSTESYTNLIRKFFKRGQSWFEKFRS